MRIAVLSIGDELLTGEVVDTNSAHIAAELFDAGCRVERQLTVGDDEGAIVLALGELARVSDRVIVTGGLGPTPDDLTAAAAARAAGQELVLSDEALAHLARFAKRIAGGLHPSNRSQALVPAGSQSIPNPLGTACGFRLRLFAADCYFLPGVPSEMKRMLADTVLPELSALGSGPPERVTLRLFGISEAAAAAALEGCLPAGSPVELAYCVQFPQILVILRGEARHAVEVRAAAAAARERLAEFVFAAGDETMDGILAGLFRASGLTLALAESCTGGMIAARITAEPGSSAYFLEGNVTYSNAAKARLLGVPMELIEGHGAVSAEVARAMAVGARRAAGSDLALSVTGIAGPDGGTPEKPVGTVYLALADAVSCEIAHCNFPGDRDAIRTITAFTALDLLRRHLIGRNHTVVP